MKRLNFWFEVVLLAVFFLLGLIMFGLAFGATITVDDPACAEFSAIKNNGSLSVTCGATTPASPPAPAPATPQCTLYASPASITAGGTSTLSVSCSPSARSLSWAGDTFGQYISSGNVSPTSTTIYSVTGSNAAGVGNTASVTVSVARRDGPVTIPQFCSNNGRPLQVIAGDLNWDIGGGNPTYSKVMGAGQSYIYRFTTGDAQATLAELDISEYIGTIPFRTVVISETPCDFDYSKSGNASGYGMNVGIYFSVGLQNGLGYKILKPRTTYFVNVKNATFADPQSDTCFGDCRFVMFLRH